MEKIRLQKYFTDCGVMSRRAAEAEILAGRVTVNGAPATLGMRIDPSCDKVEYRGKSVLPPSTPKKYILLHKPRGYVTTVSDDRGRPTVAMLTADAGSRIYPVGRLDMDSEGALLMTDDGALAERLTHPRHTVPKIYRVTVTGEWSPQTLRKLGQPMVIDGYRIRPVKVRLLGHEGSSTLLEMTLFEGRNRHIRKMCAAVNLKVTRLCRIAIGTITLDGLPVGKWRPLTPEEIRELSDLSGQAQ